MQRSAEKINSILKEVGDQLITTEGCRIEFPVRYEVVGLANIGTESTVYGFCCIKTLKGEYYSVLNICAMFPTTADEINIIDVEGIPYYEFIYHPGSTVIDNLNLLVDDKIIGKIYKEFINQGKLPYYCNYNDVNTLFDTARDFANVNLGTFESLCVPISIIARNPDNPNQYFREITDKVDVNKVKPLFVPSSSVSFSASSTLTKLTGSYYNEGIVSAINNPTEQTELIDYVLRY